MYLHTIQLYHPIGNRMHQGHAIMVDATDTYPLPPFTVSERGNRLMFVTEDALPIYTDKIGQHTQRYFTLSEGQEHEFFITLSNAARRHTCEHGRRRTFHRERTPDETYNHLESLAERHGFALLSVNHIEPSIHLLGDRGQGREFTAQCSGQLLITDLERFSEAVARGIGRKRTYGMGLLLLRDMFGPAGQS